MSLIGLENVFKMKVEKNRQEHRKQWRNKTMQKKIRFLPPTTSLFLFQHALHTFSHCPVLLLQHDVMGIRDPRHQLIQLLLFLEHLVWWTAHQHHFVSIECPPTPSIIGNRSKTPTVSDRLFPFFPPFFSIFFLVASSVSDEYTGCYWHYVNYNLWSKTIYR